MRNGELQNPPGASPEPISKAFIPQLLLMTDGKAKIHCPALARPSAFVGFAEAAGGFLRSFESLLCEAGFHCR